MEEKVLKNTSIHYWINDVKVDNVSGKSKIIFMIDSKTKPNEVKVESKKEETKKTLWDKIKGLFK